ASVMRTGRCVIVHEAARTGGFGAEIAALLAERGLASLLAPVARVTGYDTIMPLPRLEQRYIPSGARIVAATTKAWQLASNLPEIFHAPIHIAGSRRRARRG